MLDHLTCHEGLRLCPSQSCLTHLSPPVLDPGSLSGNFGEDTRTEWPLRWASSPPSGEGACKYPPHPSSLPSQRPGLDGVDSEGMAQADRGFSISGPNGVSAGASSHARTSLCVVVVNNPQIVFDFCSVFLYFYSKLSASDLAGNS